MKVFDDVLSQTILDTEYFPSTRFASGHRLGDALGSVRQMTDPTGEVTFAQSYDPYGVVTSSAGTSQTAYGFTGEQYDASTQLTYLRARYYNPADGRFLSRDTWGGDMNRPLSLNRWGYVEGNPVNLTDPSGHCYNLDDGAWDFWKWPWFGPCPLEVETTTDEDNSNCSPSFEGNVPKFQTVNVIPISDPKFSHNGQFEWPVRLELQGPAVDDGWIVQEIEAKYEKYDKVTDSWVGVNPPLATSSNYHYWEAWPVRKGESTSHLTSEGNYDDQYTTYIPEEMGRATIFGTVKFYTGGSTKIDYYGDIPYGEGWGSWEVFNIDTLAGRLPSTTTPPDFWDYCGTSHDAEYFWNGQTSWGYVRWGNSMSAWGAYK